MVEFNGKGWRLEENADPPIVLRFADEKKKIGELIDQRISFAYFTVEKEIDKEKAEKIKTISKDNMLFIAVDDILTDSKSYYKNADLYHEFICTFKYLYENAVTCGTWITDDGDIPSELGEDGIYLIDNGDKTLDIIYDLMALNSNNIFIDARGYNSKPMIDNDAWMFDSAKVSFDISVLLSAYKRPGVLCAQIEMIKKQTLAPGVLLLFQDGIDEEYRVVLSQGLLGEFDDYKICDSNEGVWGRFAFAKNSVNTSYVCIYDDDTISGERWLESCHIHMQFRTGIYGTNGILLENKTDDYPYNGWINVGWHRPNLKPYEVDFVGHSWFMEKKCLQYMFEDTKAVKEFTHVGEDMWLSFRALQNGIHTVVPPHPIRYGELWGSIPETGLKYGTSDAAVSGNFDHLDNMKKALDTIKKVGWKVLCERDKELVNQTISELRKTSEIEQIFQELDNFCENEEVYIYGAGNYGKLICGFLEKNDYKIKGIIVTNLENNENNKNHLLLPISDMKGKKAKVILGLGRRYHQAVRKSIGEVSSDITCFPSENAPFLYETFIKALEDELS